MQGVLSFDMPQVPWTTEEELFWLCCFQCTLDGRREFQKHHLDGNSNNDVPENWTVLCPNCHTLAQRDLQVAGTMTRKYSPPLLTKARELAIEACLVGRFGTLPYVNENERINEQLGRPVDRLDNSTLIENALSWLHSR